MASRLSNEDKATALDSMMKAFIAYTRSGGNDKRQIEHYETRIKELTADRILAALEKRPLTGMTKTGIHNLFGRNKSSAEIDEVIDILVESGRARAGTGGTLWRA